MVYNPLFTQDYKTVITASASELAKLTGVLRTIYTDIKSALLPLKFSIRQKCAVLAQMAKKDNEDYFVELFVTQLPLPTKFINSQEYQEKLTKKKASSEALNIFNNFKKFINSTEDTAIVYKKNPVTLTCSKAQDKLSIKIETSLKRTGKFVSRLSKVSDIEDNSSLLEIFSNAFEYFLTSNYASFPLIYENDFSVNPVEPVTLKTQNGNYITIPRITQKDYDHVKSLIKTGKNKNKFIRVDDRTRTISFFDKDTKVQDYFYGRCVPITNRDIVTFIDKPMETLFETSGFGLAKHYNWTFHNSPVKSKYQKIFNSKSSLGYLTKEVKSSLEKEGIKDFSSVTLNTEDTTVGDIILAFPVEIKQFANELDDICERSFADGGVAPTTYIRFKGTINFLRKAIENPLEIKKQSVHNQIIFNSISPEDAPSIPNVNPEISLFPHQATAIAKLNVSDDNAIIDVSTGGGKCAAGNTIIPTSEGLLSLEEIFGKKLPVKEAFNPFNAEIFSTEGYTSTNTSYCRLAGEPTLQWKFSDGTLFEGLKEHKLKVYNEDTHLLEWKRLDEIKPNDWIAKKINTNLYGTETTLDNQDLDNDNLPTKLSISLAKLFGYMVSEGTFNKVLSFTNHNPEIMQDFINCYNEVFGQNLHLTEKVTITFPKYINKFFNLHLGKKWSADRYIPICIRKAPKKYQIAFLQAIFEGDGSIYIKSGSREGSTRWVVEYTTISKKLVFQLKSMLDNIGIISNIIWKKQYRTNHVYEGLRDKRPYALTIHKNEILSFSKEIGFISQNKQDKLNDCVTYLNSNIENNFYGVDTFGIHNVLPFSNLYLKFVQDFNIRVSKFTSTVAFGVQTRQVPYTWSKLVKLTLGHYIQDRTFKKGYISRTILKGIVKTLNNIPEKLLSELEESPIFNFARRKFFHAYNNVSIYYVKAVSCKETNLKYVYDLSVPGPHSYVANGFMSHNTLVGIFDILNLMNQKKIKKPLVVVPGSLIPQWISQINFFTSNDKGVPQVNAFPITSELKASKNYQGGLESIIDNVPPNTIFITTYSFLGQYIENEENNSHIYTNVEWIQDVVNPDYMLLDESTHIKKQSTEINKACSLLGSTIQYKRIATGTLISNKAEDLIGQCCFLDPSIIGNESEFRNRYYIKGSRVPKENFAELCRNDLQNNVSYIMYRKKDWASLLPQVVYEPYFVDMSNAQRKIYRDMVRNILLEIENDPKLRKAWERLTSGNTEDYFSLSPQLLAKLAKLEQYLTAPELHKLTQYLDGEEYISPKIKKIDELIEKSISQNSKVIVAVHYKESAKHLMKYSKYSNSSVYYDAGHKDVLVRFVNDESCKVLFAVQQSLQEGLNLQCANRIIIADIDWTPGNAEQLEARINRPHLKWENGIAKNLNTNKVIYISHVLCNDSADVIKYIFQNYKRVFNSRIMEKCPVEDLMRPEFSDEGLVARFGDAIIGGQKNIDLIRSFETWQDKTIETARTENKKGFIQVKATSKLEGSKVVENLPWVSGMDLPYNESLGEIPLEEYAKQFDEFIQNPDINSIKSQILKKVARTDLGYGIIFNTTTSKKGNPGKVTIRQFIDGKVHAFSIYATIIAPEMTLGEAAKLQAKLNLRQQGKTALSAKDRVFLLEEELKKLYNIVPVKKTRLVHSNNEMDIPGYGKIIIPKGVPHYNNLLAFLKQLGAVVKRTGEPGNWSYVIQDLVSGVKSKPFKTTSDIDYKTWVELLLELRKKYNSRMLRADEIKIDIPKGNPSYDKLREIFGQYSVSLTKEKTGDEWKYYFSDRILHHQVYLPKGTTFRDKETYNYAWWIEQFLQYKKELDELYIEKGILSPKASANVPVDDTPIPKTKVKVNKKDKTVSLKEVDTPKKDKEYSTFDEDEDEEFNKSFDDDDEEIEFNDDGTEVNSPDTWEDENETSLDEDDEKEFNKSFGKDDENNNKKSDESFDEDEDSFEDESFEDDESKDNAIKLTCGIYNGILSLYVDSSDSDSEDLKNIGFIDVPPMWELYIKNKTYGENALAALKKDFKIPNTNEAEIHLILDSMKRNRYPHDFPKNVRNWLKIENKPEKDKKLLHIYPAVIDEDVFFVVNTKTNTSLNLTKYKFDKVDRYYIYFSKSDADFKRKAKEAKKILTITNWDEFVEDCKDTFNIKI